MGFGTIADVSGLNDTQAITQASAGKTIAQPATVAVPDYTQASITFYVSGGALRFSVAAPVNGIMQSADVAVASLNLTAPQLQTLRAFLARCYLTAVGT